MSANNACAQYGVTMEQLQEAKIECKWRSCHGNSYAVVKGSDVAALAARLQAGKAAAADAALVEKHGVEGLAKIRRTEAEAKAAAAKLASDAAARASAVNKVQTLMESISALCGAAGVLSPNGKHNKTGAKSAFGLSERDLAAVASVKEGRSLMFTGRDLVRAVEAKHRYGGSVLAIFQAKAPSSKARRQYAGVLDEQLQALAAKHGEGIAREARAATLQKLQAGVRASQVKVQSAQAELASKEAVLQAFSQQGASAASSSSSSSSSSCSLPAEAKKTAAKSAKRKPAAAAPAAKKAKKVAAAAGATTTGGGGRKRTTAPRGGGGVNYCELDEEGASSGSDYEDYEE